MTGCRLNRAATRGGEGRAHAATRSAHPVCSIGAAGAPTALPFSAKWRLKSVKSRRDARKSQAPMRSGDAIMSATSRIPVFTVFGLLADVPHG